jgi:hypothetical protein
MLKDSPINFHIILFLYKTQRRGSLYLSRDKQFQYVSPYNVSVTERKAEERKIMSSPATRERTSGVDRQHFLCDGSEYLRGLRTNRMWRHLWILRRILFVKKTLNYT